MEGIVSRVRYAEGKREYLVTDGANEFFLSCSEHLSHGACIQAEGELLGESKISGTRITILSGDPADKVFRRVKENILSSNKGPDAPALSDDGMIRALWPRIKEAAKTILAAKKLGRSVMLRFHGDADGIAGAFALTKILPCKAFQQNSAYYTVKDALRDIAGIGQESRPLVVILDFGSGEHCAEGLGLLKAAGMEFLVIDHHPIDPKTKGENPDWLVNPFLMGDDASKYTAGYLACEIAHICGLEKERAAGLARIACSGDKSEIMASDGDDARKALVLDFLAAHISFGNNLDFYRNVMEKPDLFDSIAMQADETIEEAAKKAMAGMRKSEGASLDIFTIPLSGIAKRGEWPSSSKITTRVYDKMRADTTKPIMCIGQTERSLIIRLNDGAIGLGLSANDLAKAVARCMADFVDGGGGHAKAGAIRVKAGFAKEVLNELIKEARTKGN
jgi:RecJ-like exonuclease